MREGNLILAYVPQADGTAKRRPVLLLRELPRFRDWLVCGVSTKVHHHVKGFDEIIFTADADFKTSGVMSESLIRLGFLAVMPHREVIGAIGFVSPERHRRLLENLSEYLVR